MNLLLEPLVLEGPALGCASGRLGMTFNHYLPNSQGKDFLFSCLSGCSSTRGKCGERLS